MFLFLSINKSQNEMVITMPGIVIKTLRLTAVLTASVIMTLTVFPTVNTFLNFSFSISAAFAAKKAKKNNKTAERKISADSRRENSIYSNAEIIADDVYIYKKGISYYENAEYDKACEYFKYIKNKRPSSFYYDMSIYLCAEAYKKTGKEDFAIENYLYLIEKCPGSNLCAEALHNIADMYRKKGISSEAAIYYKKLADSYSDSFWADEARAFLKYNRNHEIDKKADSAGNVSHNTGDASGTSSRRMEAPLPVKPLSLETNSINSLQFNSCSIDAFIDGRNEYKPVDYNGEDLKLYRDGLKFHEFKNYSKAVWCYQNFIIKYKNSLWYPNAFYMLAACYLSQGDIKAAIRFYSAALIYAKDPTLTDEIKTDLADLLYSDGQYLLALRYYESLIKTADNNERLMQIFFMIGECHTKTGNYEMAAKAYARVALAGADIKSINDGGNANKDFFEQKTDDKYSYKKSKNDISKIENSLNTTEITAGTIAEKPKAIDSKIDIKEGINYFNAKKYLKCISFFERALVDNPEEALYYRYLSLCYNQLDKAERAIGYLQKYISLISNDKNKVKIDELRQAYSTLAYIYIKENRFEEARNQYLEIIGLDAGSNAAVSAREALKRIEIIKKRAENEKK